MRTLILDALRERDPAIRTAADILLGGGLVAFPTETVYGLGGLGLSLPSLDRIFAAKGRPATDPLILHVADPSAVGQLAREVSPLATSLMERFWPGPLTLVLPRSPAVPDRVTAGLDGVAVRMPAHPIALDLLRAVGAPLAAPSANLFGHVSPTCAEHVMADLDGRIDAVLDGGPTAVGVESTVVDLTGPEPVILRPGGISAEALMQVVPLAVVRQGLPALSESVAQASPGMLIRHYSPKTEVRLYEGTDAGKMLLQMVKDAQGYERPVILAHSEELPVLADLRIQAWDLGPRSEPEVMAGRLYTLLRRADSEGASVILVATVYSDGIGAAINDRLLRAASGRVIRV